jgi:hypothetical protein
VARPAAPVARPAQPVARAPAPQPQRPIAPARPSAAKPPFPNSNVREVLKALEETSNDTEITGQTRMMPAPPVAGFAAHDDTFSDTQVL